MRRAVCLFMSCMMSLMGCDAHAATQCYAGHNCPASAPSSTPASSPTPAPSPASSPPQTSGSPVATKSATAGSGNSTGSKSQPNPSSGGGGAGTAVAVAAGALAGFFALIASLPKPASTPSADGASQPGAAGPASEGSVLPSLQVASVPIAASAPERLGIVPNLLGLTVSAALRTLEQHGLVIGVDDKDPGASGRHVATQSIMPGERVPLGTAVTVTLNPAPAPLPQHKPPAPHRAATHHSQDPLPPVISHPAPPVAVPEPAPPPVPPMPEPPPNVAPLDSDNPSVVVGMDQPADWWDATLGMAILALAGAAAYAARKWWLGPHLVYHISMCADAGQQSCRMSRQHAHLPSVDVRLASQPWEAHVVDAFQSSQRKRDHVRRPRHA